MQNRSADTRPINLWHNLPSGGPILSADAYAPREALQFAVSGLLTLPSLSIVYGAPGTLKSFLLADMAINVAAGLPWLAALPGEGDIARAVIQSPAMWIDFDNGARRTHERFDALGHAYKLPADVPIVYYSMPSAGLDAGDTAAMVTLADRIKEHRGAVGYHRQSRQDRRQG